jgi:hypothetical protein
MVDAVLCDKPAGGGCISKSQMAGNPLIDRTMSGAASSIAHTFGLDKKQPIPKPAADMNGM